MKVLVIGSGGREHALVWKLVNSPSVEKVYAVPGNPGIAELAETYPLNPKDFDSIVSFCREHLIDLVVPGPESPIIAGMANVLREAGIAVYGPSREAAQLEGSKAFAKELMAQVGIPTAPFETFCDYEEARRYLQAQFRAGRPMVVKVSGEAQGKGAFVCDTEEEALQALHRILVQKEFGEAGNTVVIEERLFGRELSLFAICQGEEYVLLPSAQDYKTLYEGGRGPNTGGMGAYSPVLDVGDETLREYAQLVVEPVLKEMRRRGTPYVGTLYAGLMLTEEGPRVLEYNVRFGDPETQVVLPRLRGDFGELCYRAATQQALPPVEVEECACVGVVISAPGYPGTYEQGIPLPPLVLGEGLLVFHAGTRYENGRLVSSGGRVLTIVCCDSRRDVAVSRLYSSVEKTFGTPWHFRRDIGL